MTQPLIILGTGGNAYDLLDIVDAINHESERWRVEGFLDDSRPPGSDYLGFKVLGPLNETSRWEQRYFINAIGSDKSYLRRPEIMASTGLSPDRFATLIHPQASVSARAHLGRGVYVNYGASIGGGVTIGNHVALGPHCIIGHDSRIEDYAVLAPGAIVSGFVQIESNCYIGAASSIRQQLRIGARSLVGIGAVVVRDVPVEAVVAGNPARPLAR